MAISQPLPSQDLEVLAHAAFVNSRQQLVTAELLLENGHWPVAYALSTLALEEVGKAFLCIFASTSPEIFRDVFWKVFVSHTIKLQLAHFALAPMAAGTAAQPSSDPVQAIMTFGQMAQANHSTKMRGLYVDYTDGAVLDPADVTEQDAQTMVAHARAALDHLAPATTDKGLDPELRAILAAGADHFTRLFHSPDTDFEELIQQVWDQVVAGAVEPPAWIPPDMLPGLGRRAPLPHGTTSTTTPASPDMTV